MKGWLKAGDDPKVDRLSGGWGGRERWWAGIPTATPPLGIADEVGARDEPAGAEAADVEGWGKGA